MRCIACNRILEPEDLLAVKFTEEDGTKHYEDMCSWCRDEAYGTYTYITDKEYTFEELEPNLPIIQEKA